MKVGPDPSLPWPIDYDAGVLELAQSEGCRLNAYRCPAGKWTCGWGETDGVGPNTAWTQDYADQRLCDSLRTWASAVRDMCTVEPTAYQLAALVSLAYNIGLAGLRKSTVLRCHNRGEFLAASRAFGLWNKHRDPATKRLVESEGLTARRARESALYLRQAEQTEAMPQAVAAESALTSSPIAQSGAVTAGAGVVGLITAAGEQLGTVMPSIQTAKTFATDTLGIPADWFLPGLLLAVGALVLWQRAKQRGQGWA